MIDNFIILVLIVGAFIGGLVLAGYYYRKLLAEWKYVAKVLAAEKGLGYIAQPDDSLPLGKDFMERLKETGNATKVLRSRRQ